MAVDLTTFADAKGRVPGRGGYNPDTDIVLDYIAYCNKRGIQINLRGADLAGADLTGVILRRAYLPDAKLDRVKLAGAKLCNANLARARLIGSYLIGADFSGATLSGANLTGAVLEMATLSRADLSEVKLIGTIIFESKLRQAKLTSVNIPTIPSIHQTVYAAASQPDALDMVEWHSYCGTVHCRAGWVIALAGEPGRKLEAQIGPSAAAAFIYWASDPFLKQVPNWYHQEGDALADMRRLAEDEAEREVKANKSEK